MPPPGLPDLTALAPTITASDPERCWSLLHLLNRGLAAVDPETTVARALQAEDPPGDDLTVVALGKAAPAMARGASTALGCRARRLLVVSDHHEPVPAQAELLVTSHPIPDRSSLVAGRRLLEAVRRASDHVVFLVSGGGSSLAEVPVRGVSLDDLVTVYDLLLRHGVPIQDANVVRSRLSALKGGRLGAATSAATTTVVLSDVGPRLELVASGPSIPSPSEPLEAVAVLRRHGLLERFPSAALAALEADVQIVGGNPGKVLAAGDGDVAIRAIAAAGDDLGLPVSVITSCLEGEAADTAHWARETVPEGVVGAMAGETVVTVRGTGRGGRNQHAALAACILMEDEALVTFGTDGIDGPTDAAGAYVDGSTADRIRREGIDPEAALADNDSYTALAAAGSLLRPGPTGMNVADLWLMDKR